MVSGLSGSEFRAVSAAVAMLLALPVMQPLPGIAATGRIPVTSEVLAQTSIRDMDVLARLALTEPADTGLGEETRRKASAWLASQDASLLSAGALLLAELGHMDPAVVNELPALLIHPHDLYRYRTRAVLEQDRPASKWTKDSIEILAGHASRKEGAGEATYLISTGCGWALNHVEHNRPDWLAEWAQDVDTKGADERHLSCILSSIHLLTDDAWPFFLTILPRGGSSCPDGIARVRELAVAPAFIASPDSGRPTPDPSGLESGASTRRTGCYRRAGLHARTIVPGHRRSASSGPDRQCAG